MTEKERMLAGKLYKTLDPELGRLQEKAHNLAQQYNATPQTEYEKRAQILHELLPNMGEGTYLQGPLQFDYGVFTTIGDHCYANFNFTVLDCCPVHIGNNVFFGPNVSIMTPLHPLLPSERNMRFSEDGQLYDTEYAAPITIEDDCWIAANVVVCGGVTIGRGTVIGAGSVVTRDIPSGVVAAGNPCRVIRPITEDDSVYKKEELL